ncbi:MAG: acyltransferase [Ferruginibacter sp.]
MNTEKRTILLTHNSENTIHTGGTKKAGSRLEFNSIQCLRFVAALMVVLLHATFYAEERLDSTVSKYEPGAHGVPLFFVISGFVMILSSQNLIDDKNGWKKFAVKRIVRIVPIYWIIATIKLLVMLTTSKLVLHSQFDLGYVLKSYFFIPAFNPASGLVEPLLGVGWTLNFEMFFYLIFTLSLFFKFNRMWFIGTVLLSLSVISLFKKSTWPAVGFYADPIVMDFFWGMIAGLFIMKGKFISGNTAIFLILLGLSILFLPVMYYLGSYNSVHIWGIASFLVVYGCASIESSKSINYNSIVLFFGTASYSLYLIHPIIAPLAPSLFKHFGLIWPVFSILLSMALALAAGAVCYYALERPISKKLNTKMRQLEFFQKKP